jgi:ATP-dependent Clp protease ATP-binding subunit ClpB
VNRIDEIVVFEPLTREQIGAIVDIQIRLLAKRLAERSLGLELTEAAGELIAARGFDPAFGARPLKRLIQREIQDPLAVKLLSGEIGEGDTVLVDADGESLAFRAVSTPDPARAEPD